MYFCVCIYLSIYLAEADEGQDEDPLPGEC